METSLPKDLIHKIWKMKASGATNREVACELGISSATVCKYANLSVDTVFSKPKEKIEKPKLLRFSDLEPRCPKITKTAVILTACMSNAPVNLPFLRCLESVARDLDADLVVGGVFYANNNVPQHARVDDGTGVTFDSTVLPYLLLKTELNLFEGKLKVVGDVNITATSSNPLAVFTEYSEINVAFHSKLRLKDVPSFDYPATLTTTGAVSIPSYTKTTAGYRSEKEHSYCAALIYEGADGELRLWQLEYNEETQSVFTPEHEYCADGGIHGTDIAAISLADIHAWESSAHHNKLETFISELLGPISDTNIVVGDVASWCKYSHHRNKLPVQEQFPSPREEFQIAAKLLYNLSCYGKVVVIDSNHHDHSQVYLENLKTPNELVRQSSKDRSNSF
jgi:hypothetical protein